MSSHQRSHLCPAGVRVPVHLHARHTVCILHIIPYLLDILYAYILHIINICYNLYIYIFCNKTYKYVKLIIKQYLLNIFHYLHLVLSLFATNTQHLLDLSFCMNFYFMSCYYLHILLLDLSFLIIFQISCTFYVLSIKKMKFSCNAFIFLFVSFCMLLLIYNL